MRFSTGAKTKEVQTTPTDCMTCWRHGVAPSRWPVFRSCMLSPEIAAAHALPPLRACQFPSQRRRHRVGGMFIKKVSPGTPERLLRYLEINRSTPRGATTKIKSQRLAFACLATNGSASMACGRALNTGAKVLESQLSALFQHGRLNMEP